MTDECIFCKIIRGDIPCKKVYEDDNVFAFLDISPNNPGHTLVIPKKHYTDIVDLPEDDAKNMITVAKKISTAILESTEASGVNLIMNNKAVAGQIVFHAHMHVIPRIPNDGYQHWPGGQYAEGEAESVQEKIVSFLENH